MPGESVLVVDDEDSVRELIVEILEAAGFRVSTASDGAEGLERMEADTPELVLSDINMPGMDGLALLREIKTRWADLPVMMVTAYGDDERRRRAGEYGALEFITKPVDFDLLKEQLRQLPSGAA